MVGKEAQGECVDIRKEASFLQQKTRLSNHAAAARSDM